MPFEPAAMRSPVTAATYARDAELFDDWCRAQGGDASRALPITLSDYLRVLRVEGLAPATLRRRATAITDWCRRNARTPQNWPPRGLPRAVREALRA